MSRRLIAAAAGAAALLVAPAVLAQSQAPAAEAAAPATPEEQAMQAAAEAFALRMGEMSAEVNTVVGQAVEAGADSAAAADAAAAVTARYSADIEAFAVQAESFFRQQAERPELANQRAELLARADEVGTDVRAIPTTVRDQVRQQVDAYRAQQGG